jgi:hypothetical protein
VREGSRWRADCSIPLHAVQAFSTEAPVTYTIEARRLTNESNGAPPDAEPKQLTIEAASPADAISEFVRRNDSELVSLSRPLTGRESIATVRKDDFVFLVRVSQP